MTTLAASSTGSGLPDAQLEAKMFPRVPSVLARKPRFEQPTGRSQPCRTRNQVSCDGQTSRRQGNSLG